MTGKDKDIEHRTHVKLFEFDGCNTSQKAGKVSGTIENILQLIMLIGDQSV